MTFTPQYLPPQLALCVCVSALLIAMYITTAFFHPLLAGCPVSSIVSPRVAGSFCDSLSPDFLSSKLTVLLHRFRVFCVFRSIIFFGTSVSLARFGVRDEC